MPGRSIREGMAREWTPEKKAEQSIAYRKLWTEQDIMEMKRKAQAAGISGFDGAYAKCVTHNGDNVIIDRKCLADAARNTGLGDAYRDFY